MKKWFVVYTKAGQERLAEGNLRAQGFTTYMPILAVRKKQGRKTIAATVPMFSRYLFVQGDLETMRWRSINGTYGVSGLVTFGERPASVKDGVIDELRDREDVDGVIRLAAVSPFQEGDAVEVTEGPLSHVKGLFSAKTANERGIVLMSLLGREVPVKLNQQQLRRAS